MSATTNPYESPIASPIASPAEAPPFRIDWLTIWGWPAVFAANAVVPTSFGLSVIGNNEGRFGMALGCVVMLTIGWIVCLIRPKLIRTTITGACLVMISQLFPIFQMIAGSLSIAAAEKMGMPIVRKDEEMLKISGDTTTFVVTMSTAALHIGLAFAIGAAISVLLGFHLNDKAAKPASLPEEST